MNPKHLHTPLSTRARCPVCHEAVYSRSGIHPQCAVRQSEPPKAKKVGPISPSQVEPVSGAPEQTGADVVIDPPTAERNAASDPLPV